MKSIAIIPLRAGSKGIPGKNKRKILGRPLYQWVLGEAISSDLDEVYVFTDDEDILEQVELEYSWTSKVRTMQRSIESATDTASTEMAMLELAERVNYDFDLICLLQATSPLTQQKDINATLNKIITENFDSALTVVETKRFIWSTEGKSLNYDFLERPRRQDFDGMLIENGAVYIAKKETFIENQNRLGGSIGIVHMPEDTLAEVDELSDWPIVNELLINRLIKLKGKGDQIKYLVLDVDGVFTDGKVAVSPEGELFKLFSIRDGMGLEILRNNEITPIVITSENSAIVARRMEKLQIKHVLLGVKDKFARLNHFCKEECISRSEIAYVGDDVNDLSNLCAVGWGLTPNDALPEVKQVADIILNNKGGDMAIREAVEFIINQNKRY